MRLVTAFKMVEEDLSPNYQMYLFENMDIVFKIVRAPHSCFNSFLKRYFYSFQINSHYQIAFSDYRFLLRNQQSKKAKACPFGREKDQKGDLPYIFHLVIIIIMRPTLSRVCQ